MVHEFILNTRVLKCFHIMMWKIFLLSRSCHDFTSNSIKTKCTVMPCILCRSHEFLLLVAMEGQSSKVKKHPWRDKTEFEISVDRINANMKVDPSTNITTEKNPDMTIFQARYFSSFLSAVSHSKSKFLNLLLSLIQYRSYRTNWATHLQQEFSLSSMASANVFWMWLNCESQC